MNAHLAPPSSVPSTPPSSPSSVPSRPSLPWLLILGLASLAVLWPLTGLWGLGQGASRALTLLALTGAVWIGVVGVGRVRHPVLTLTATGILHGLLLLGLGGVLAGSGPLLAGDGPFDGPARLLLLLPSLAMDAGIGALLGVVALGVQTVLGPRRDGSALTGTEA